MLLSCGINKEEHTDEVHNHDEQAKKVIFNEAQLKELYAKGNEFISFLANSEVFDSTYSIQSEHFLLFEIHNSRPLESGYSNYAVEAFIDLVGEGEREYIIGQIEAANSFKLDIKEKGKPIPVPYDSLALVLTERGGISWTKYNRHFDGWVYFIDPPIFSRDGRFALTEHGYMCGLMCGGFSAEIYKEVLKNQWKRIKVISREEA
ncbi:hypothetical protein GCM10023188_05640 [Pontibacter saemangeumensis]|uniref:Uncharacterized protein n=2 Tax=Pontibacter saemangeumensis TaxID=1084525 RepID=A0ABP8LA04_9BACT